MKKLAGDVSDEVEDLDAFLLGDSMGKQDAASFTDTSANNYRMGAQASSSSALQHFATNPQELLAM